MRRVVRGMGDAPDHCHDERRCQEYAKHVHVMKGDIPFDVFDVDEVLEDLNERDADYRQRRFHLQNSGIDVVKPLRPIAHVFDFQLADENLMAALNDHDQQVCHHGDVDQTQQGDHDFFGGERKRMPDQREVFDDELGDIDRQGQEETDVDRVKNPAGGKNCCVETDHGAS